MHWKEIPFNRAMDKAGETKGFYIQEEIDHGHK
jgi:hypothetical protein